MRKIASARKLAGAGTKKRLFPALAKLEKEPKMKAVEAVWKQGSKTGNWSTTFHGIGIVIKVEPKTSQATEVQFFINGKLDESAPLSCSVSDAQKIGLEVVDRLIEDTPHWKAAEYRHNSDIWKKP